MAQILLCVADFLTRLPFFSASHLLFTINRRKKNFRKQNNHIVRLNVLPLKQWLFTDDKHEQNLDRMVYPLFLS
jgi:hypothetical protein